MADTAPDSVRTHSTDRRFRVVQWGTGPVGAAALRGVARRPDLDLVGVWVSSSAKEGRDAGELAELDTPLGVAATQDAGRLLALAPDAILYNARADERPMEAIDDICGFLAAGINVLASGPTLLQYPYGAVPEEMIAQLQDAGVAGNASLWVNGIDPGFANDVLPLLLTGVCTRIDSIRCLELLDYSTYGNREMMFDMMGFGRPLDDVPTMLTPGMLSMALAVTVRQLAAALGLELDEVTEHHDRRPAINDLEVAVGTIKTGTTAAIRFGVDGRIGDRVVFSLEHVTRLHPDLAPEWPMPAGPGSYRVEVRGDPDLDLDLRLSGPDGNPVTAGFSLTAMRLVNAVPAVCAARPGIITAIDLPLLVGRGLVS
ncbi:MULTISPECIES: diacylglycerol kinase [unclassified Mycobacterium]|uniref:NAD(P)H-dependent amine dehydrogenase family protein n=1 Tax=unclassified Mycobacterium TaxID=2642494 RepID=UPI0029C7EDFC|nr:MULTISPECIES: diacylglycerol kinase [unclassified Mycobacterium]